DAEARTRRAGRDPKKTPEKSSRLMCRDDQPMFEPMPIHNCKEARSAHFQRGSSPISPPRPEPPAIDRTTGGPRKPSPPGFLGKHPSPIEHAWPKAQFAGGIGP